MRERERDWDLGKMKSENKTLQVAESDNPILLLYNPYKQHSYTIITPFFSFLSLLYYFFHFLLSLYNSFGPISVSSCRFFSQFCDNCFSRVSFARFNGEFVNWFLCTGFLGELLSAGGPFLSALSDADNIVDDDSAYNHCLLINCNFILNNVLVFLFFTEFHACF